MKATAFLLYPIFSPSCSFSCKFTAAIYLAILAQIYHSALLLYSIKYSIILSAQHSKNIKHPYKKLLIGNTIRKNLQFTRYTLYIAVTVIVGWLIVLLLLAGDVHPNPGPMNISNYSVTVSDISTDNDLSSSSTNTSDICTDLSHNLSLVHYNVQSIKPKLDILYAELFGFDILTFSETWLDDTVPSSELLFSDFHPPERKDRANDRHGGVIAYVKQNIPLKRRTDLELNGIECIWIQITLKHKPVLIGTFYRPPNSDIVYTDMIQDSINLAIDTGIKDIIITGDFNYNLLNHSSAKPIDSISQQYDLTQVITEPTHYTETSYSLIDLLLLNNKDSLIKAGVSEPFLDQNVRYHCPIYGVFKFRKPRFQSYERRIWSYERGDYDLLRHKISHTNWGELVNNDVNIYATNITETLMNLSSLCIPNKLLTVKPHEPCWLSTEIKRQIRQRKRAYRKAKSTNSLVHWEKFRHIRNKTIQLIRKSKETYYNNLANKLKSRNLSQKDWWKTLKAFISSDSKPSVPPLVNNDHLLTDSEQKANLLNDFFVSQSSLDDSNIEPPLVHTNNSAPSLVPELITPEQVKSVLKSLPSGKASGPDLINNCILSKTSNEISEPLCNLFNSCMSSKVFPRIWKEAYVTAVFKKGDPSIVNNYRPISLLSVIGKVFEKLIFRQIFNFLKDTDFLSPYQSGFVPGDSTINQLTQLYNTFCQAIDSGKEVRVIFFDISKAFDRVWHKGLISKLKVCGLSDEYLLLLRDYLSERKQCVVLPGAKSDWKDVKAGVPQGSILGPLLFLVYINDIASQVNSNIRLFADDTSLYLVIDHPNNIAISANSLNEDILKISQWASQWLVTFNPNKSESMLISRKQHGHLHPPLYMDNQVITDVQNHKHLGVFLSNDCTWHTHIDYIKAKTWPKINIMRKLLYHIDRKSLETIFLTFIRPLLEYADVIWDNCTEYEKTELDKIQYEAARICTGATKLISLNNLTKEIGWESLRQRRNKHKLILFYKMVNNHSPQYLSDLVPRTVSQQSQYNLRNTHNIQLLHARTTGYYNSFLPSVIREWNTLPSQMRNASTLDEFKSLLNMDKIRTPNHFYTGDRKAQVLHTRLRTECSALNQDLFSKGVVDSPLCRCGLIENAHHFFFACPHYQTIRIDLFNSVSHLCSLSLKNLLYGDESLSTDTNSKIFLEVQKFIIKSKRFL